MIILTKDFKKKPYLIETKWLCYLNGMEKQFKIFVY
jgi:hypothetical protein